jgi:hypothetical protein
VALNLAAWPVATAHAVPLGPGAPLLELVELVPG